jgi:hypothetical protein
MDFIAKMIARNIDVIIVTISDENLALKCFSFIYILIASSDFIKLSMEHQCEKNTSELNRTIAKSTSSTPYFKT